MRNIDKYYEDLISCACNWDYQKSVSCRVYELRTGRISAKDCDCDCEKCYLDSLKWLNQKHKEPLSEAERNILSNIDKQYQYIARDKNGDLYIYKYKPHKKQGWCCHYYNGFYCFSVFNHLFQMVLWDDEEPTLIADLLKE